MLPLFLQKYFWDTDAEKLDSQKNASYVMERILEYGDLDAVRWMMENYERNSIIAVVQRSRTLSKKSASFWAFFLGVPKSDIVCLSKQFRTRSRAIWSR